MCGRLRPHKNYKTTTQKPLMKAWFQVGIFTSICLAMSALPLDQSWADTGNLTIGNRSEGNILTTINDGAIFGNRSMALRNLRVTELHAKVRELGGQYKAAIYSDNNGAADRLLQGSAEVKNP